MSRRLATVVRVAALQERLAKAEAGRAAVALASAVQLQDARRAALSAGALVAGSPTDLQQALALQALRAQAVDEALADTQSAEAGRSTALDAWTAARGRARLLGELDARVRAQQRADEERAAQALADDLSAGRRGAR